MFMNTPDEQIKTCHNCKRVFPIKTANGKPNFFPAAVEGGTLVDYCIECKLVESDRYRGGK